MGFINNLGNTFSRAFNFGKSAYPLLLGNLASANRTFGKLDSKVRAFGNLANVLTDGKLKTSQFGKKVMDGYDKAQEINTKSGDIIPSL
jgi:hypothetical protein